MDEGANLFDCQDAEGAVSVALGAALSHGRERRPVPGLVQPGIQEQVSQRCNRLKVGIWLDQMGYWRGVSGRRTISEKGRSISTMVISSITSNPSRS